MKKNILFHAINGTWYWHVQRSINVIDALESNLYWHELHFHLASSCENIISSDLWNIAFHKLSYWIQWNYRKYSAITLQELSVITHEEKIDIMFHDTFFIIDVIQVIKHVDHHFIYRLTSLEHFLSIKKHLLYFKKIFVPHSKEEFLSIIPQEYLNDLGEEFIFLWYIDPAWVWKYSPEYTSSKKNIVVSPWMWWDSKNVMQFLKHIHALFSKAWIYKSDYKISVYIGINSNLKEVNEVFSKKVKIHPFSSTYRSDFKEADIFIWRWWYNSVLESIYLWKPCIFFPAHRKNESQKNRISYFSKKVSYVYLWKYSIQDDISSLKKILDSEKVIDTIEIKNSFTWGQKLSDYFIREYDKPVICFFQDSHLEKSQNFVMDELIGLSKYFQICIFTLHITNNSLTKNNFRIFYDKNLEGVFLKNGHNNVNLYQDIYKKQLNFFLKQMYGFIKSQKIEIIYTPFLWDITKVMYIKQYDKKLKIYSCARWNDIYNIFHTYPEKVKNNIIRSVDGVFARDTFMEKYLNDSGFKKSDIQVVRSWKFLDHYNFDANKKIKWLCIWIWWRIVEKKGMLETLQLLRILLSQKKKEIDKIYFIWSPTYPEGYIWSQLSPENYIIFMKKHIAKVASEWKALMPQLRYWLRVMEYILHHEVLHKNIEFKWFLEWREYKSFLQKDINMFIWHFKIAKNGDREGIPNIVIENILSHNLIFSTVVGGIWDILIDKKTGYTLSGNMLEDAKKIIKFSMRDNIDIIKVAHKTISNEFDISIQVKRIANVFHENY